MEIYIFEEHVKGGLMESIPENFYICMRENPQYGVFITVLDKDVIEKNTFFRGFRYDRVVRSDELVKELRNAASIIFYGEKAVDIGIKLKYIHPDAIGFQKGIKTAIYIRTF